MNAHHWIGDDDRDSRPEDRPDPIWLTCASCDGAEEFAHVVDGIGAGWRQRDEPGRLWDCPLCAETRYIWGEK